MNKKIMSILMIAGVFAILTASLIGCSFFSSKRYTYNFYVNDTIYYSEEVKRKDDIVLPLSPEQKGYTFQGWGYSEAKTPIDITTLDLNNYDFTAIFSINQYSLTVDGVSESYPYDSVVSLPSLSRVGYTFRGYRDVEDVLYLDNVRIRSDMILTSVWSINTYYLYNTEYDLNIPYTIEDNEITLPLLYQEGYDFLGYGLDPSDARSELIFSYRVADYACEDHEIRPVFERHTITVTYIYGDTIKEETVYSLDDCSILSHEERPGYSFKGWYKDQSYTEKFTDTLYPCSDLTLYGLYELNHYTITLLNTDNTVYKTLDYTAQDIWILPDVTRKGYAFSGWGDDSHIYYETLPVLLADKTLIATWHLMTYTITINGNIMTYTIEDNITLPLLSQTGYTFLGYQINGQGDYYTVLTADILTQWACDLAVFPAFSVNTYYIYFDTRGGEDLTPLPLKYDQTISLPTPIASNKTFTEWYSDSYLSQNFNQTVMGAADITVYAGYAEDERVHITYTNGIDNTSVGLKGTVASGCDYLKNSFITLRADFIREGYQFKAWYCGNKLYSYDSDIVIEGTQDFDFYAQYDAINIQKYSLDNISNVRLSYMQTPTWVKGSGLTDKDYTLSDTIELTEDYVRLLGEGVFTYYTDCGEYIFLELSYSGSIPCDITLDYDSCYPYVVLNFYGTGTYELYLNGVNYDDCYNGMILEDYDKSRDNTLTLRNDYHESTTMTRAGYTAESEPYYTRSFTWGGRSYDYVMESLEQFYQWVQYVILVEGLNLGVATTNYPNGTYEGLCYLDYDWGYWTGENLISNALRTCSIPMGLYYSYQLRGNIYEIDCYYATSYNTEISCQTLSVLADKQACLTRSNRSDDYADFAINSYSKTATIRNLYELENLPYGYRPLCEEGSREEAVYEAAQAICRTYISDTMNDYEKVKVFYDWIAINVTYDYEMLNETLQGSYRSHTSYGVLIDKLGVCDGISMAFKLLCAIEGIECIEVVGSAQGGGHAWNKVCIDGCWYAVDATWARTKGLYVSHMFLLMDEGYTIQSQHSEMAQANYPQIYHLATGTLNYYERTLVDASQNYNLVIDSVSEMMAVLKWGKARGMTVIDVETSASDAATFKRIVQQASFMIGIRYRDCVGYGNNTMGYVYYITL